jgi:hypothetical protein
MKGILGVIYTEWLGHKPVQKRKEKSEEEGKDERGRKKRNRKEKME